MTQAAAARAVAPAIPTRVLVGMPCSAAASACWRPSAPTPVHAGASLGGPGVPGSGWADVGADVEGDAEAERDVEGVGEVLFGPAVRSAAGAPVVGPGADVPGSRSWPGATESPRPAPPSAGAPPPVEVAPPEDPPPEVPPPPEDDAPPPEDPPPGVPPPPEDDPPDEDDPPPVEPPPVEDPPPGVPPPPEDDPPDEEPPEFDPPEFDPPELDPPDEDPPDEEPPEVPGSVVGGGGAVTGRCGAIRGGGLVVDDLFFENDQPSKLPVGGLRFVTRHWLYVQFPPFGACQ
ncbi:hypothetical protein ACFWIN_02885 [Streptomyces sp. NPDC127049]|uniref:hypothetical protein n=1 Tax=Streptomyces sp. NPDC127049 TaxID=3347118 RepID=UPI003663D8C7